MMRRFFLTLTILTLAARSLGGVLSSTRELTATSLTNSEEMGLTSAPEVARACLIARPPSSAGLIAPSSASPAAHAPLTPPAVHNTLAVADTVRYVGGDKATYAGDGRSWATATSDLQGAIDDLHNYLSLNTNDYHTGTVYVARGEYTPRRSTEAGNDAVAYTAFQIYGGITVVGGYRGYENYDPNRASDFTDGQAYPGEGAKADGLPDPAKAAELLPANRIMNQVDNNGAADGRTLTWRFRYRTTLTGAHIKAERNPLSWDATRKTYTTHYGGHSYHVVWFATNGFYTDASGNALSGDQAHRARPLEREAVLDGFLIRDGYASNRTTQTRQHTSYGGGVYMVGGAVVRNCIITQCTAARGGGGAYLDGGGELHHCFLSHNFSPGVTIGDGYGGAVLIEHYGSLHHTFMGQNQARVGGGFVISRVGLNDYPGKQTLDNLYSPSAADVTVTNCTATAEAGGAALRYGGVINHATIVRNECTGHDLVFDGRHYGRSAGLYIDEDGAAFNTVCWGGKAEANRDVQFASFKTKDSNAPHDPNGSKPYVAYSAFSNYGRTAWNTAVKFNCIALEAENTGQAEGYYAEFKNPADADHAGVQPLWQRDASGNAIKDSDGKEKEATRQTVITTPAFTWIPMAASQLRAQGMQLDDYPGNGTFLTHDAVHHAHVTHDYEGRKFVPRTTIGSLIPEEEKMQCVLFASQEPGETGDIPTLFVNPERAQHASVSATNVGDSWDAPLANINDALHFFQTLSKDGKIRYNNTDYDHAQILVKQGSTTCAGTRGDSYDGGSLRTASLYMVSGVRLYGGYPSGLKATNVVITDNQGKVIASRNPALYPTRVSANLSSDSYANNAAHIVTFANVTGAILDGFQLYGGNATPGPLYTPTRSVGAGILATNDIPDATPVAMDNKVRNCVIAHCSATDGAAVYAEAASATQRLAMENCIVRNNECRVPSAQGARQRSTATRASGANSNANPAAITASGLNVTLALDHCTIRGNVGNAVKADDATATLTNSALHANAAESHHDARKLNAVAASAPATADINATTEDAHILGIIEVNNGSLTGSCNLADAALNTSSSARVSTGGQAIKPAQAPNRNASPSRVLDSTPPNAHSSRVLDSTPPTRAGTQLEISYSLAYSPTVVENGQETPNPGFPRFKNPTRNIGVTETLDDVTLYGGTPDFMPQNMSPLVNRADDSGQAEWGRDLTTTTPRSYGGLPDIGAVENTDLPKYGSVIYVTPDGAGKGDGSSWSNAIAGNHAKRLGTNDTPAPNNGTENYTGTAYTADHAFLTAETKNGVTNYDAEPYDSGTALTGLQWAVDEAFNRSLHETERTEESNIPTEEYNSSGKWAVSNNTLTVSRANVVDEKRVQVWVAEGDYTRDNGFFMRNGVDVYGAFPGQGNPTLNDRDTKLYVSNLMTQADNVDTYPQETISQEGKTDSYDTNRGYSLAYARAHRVLTQQMPYYRFTVTNENKEFTEPDQSPNYPVLDFDCPTTWDGFTIKNGHCKISNKRDGGAGVSLRKNGRIRNCIVKNNVMGNTKYGRGGGVFCNGGIIENCQIIGNTLNGTDDNYGGGLYMRSGDCFNTIVADNTNQCKNDHAGAAAYFEDGNFYNNTVTGNTGTSALATNTFFRGITVNIYNTIVYKNNVTNEFYLNKSTTQYTTTVNVGKCLLENTNTGTGAPTYKRYLGTGVSLTSDALLPATDATAVFVDRDNGDYHLAANSPAVNAGMELFETIGITLPDKDADFTARVQDCAVDIGAYEQNSAENIARSSETEDGVTVHYYYVTQNGAGTRNGSSPANAACALKIQKILDHAGRALYANINTTPTDRYVVKLAGDATGEFKYSPQHADDSDDPRAVSVIVPHGVELWGGYNDQYTDDKNQTVAAFTERDILKYKTTLTGHPASSAAQSYHTLTFTDHVFDANGNLLPGQSLSEATNKAIADGLFIEDGNADGERTISAASVNMTRVGGGAVVTGYAHLRNCVVQGNSSADGGGGVYMLPKAIVSGCIVQYNTTEGNGGGIAVDEPQGLTVGQLGESTWAIIACSDIIKNRAKKQGGGLAFENNLRSNSSLYWRNECNDEEDIAGTTDPFDTEADHDLSSYPLSCCAVENLTVAGINNVRVPTDVAQGVRFTLATAKDNPQYTLRSDDEDQTYHVNLYPFYYPQENSMLVRAGMDYATFARLQHDKYPTISLHDIAGVERMGTNASTPYNNGFIEIGARAYGQDLLNFDDQHILTRLFVCHSDAEGYDLDNDMKLGQSNDDTYKQRGSSMLRPFSRLDDALEYIRRVRINHPNDMVGSTNVAVKNTRFEVYITEGTYMPLRNLSDNYSESRGNTYLVPEKVSIIGGIDATKAYCQATDPKTPVMVNGVTLEPKSTADILSARARDDQNNNNIIEPWEFQRQSILSGNIVSNTSHDNAYHILTCIADESKVGALPDAGTDNTGLATGAYDGTQPKENGQPVILDGLTFMEGRAHTFSSAVDNLDTYYKGGAICVNGSWIGGRAIKPAQTGGRAIKHAQAPNANATTSRVLDSTPPMRVPAHKNTTATAAGLHHPVGYRNIPLEVYNCQFQRNEAGLGAAIFSDGGLKLFGSAFTQNTAAESNGTSAKYTDDNGAEQTVADDYPGNGGAVFAASYLTLANCLFANNEAHTQSPAPSAAPRVEREASASRQSSVGDITREADASRSKADASRSNEPAAPQFAEHGVGGAIAMGDKSHLYATNCDFVCNQAEQYPAIFVHNPNQGGELASPSSARGGQAIKPAQAPILASSSPRVLDSTPPNAGSSPRVLDSTPPAIPSDCDANILHKNPHTIVNTVFWHNKATDETNANYNRVYPFGPETSSKRTGVQAEALWFCAYEQGRGLEPISSRNGFDYRRVPFPMDKGFFIPDLLRLANTADNSTDGLNHTTCNIIISTDNTAADGPNFINPATEAGVKGALQNADWMVGRVNYLVDNGWTMLTQEKGTDGNLQFKKDASDTRYEGGGFYWTTAYKALHVGQEPQAVPIGDEPYMWYNNATEGTDAKEADPMQRVSYDPSPSHGSTYIDIGLYEYQHKPLKFGGDQDDILWVTQDEVTHLDPNDGSTQERATSDLQRAIETLLFSRNDRKKELRIMEGQYLPQYVLSGNLGFQLTTDCNPSDAIFADDDDGSAAHGVQAMKISGGWSKDLPDTRDPQKYPTYLIDSNLTGATAEEMSHLMVIGDMRRRSQVSGSTTVTCEDAVVPVTLEGLHFSNVKAVPNANNAGAAVEYQAQTVKNGEGKQDGLAVGAAITKTWVKGADGKTWTTSTTAPKLIIKECQFMINGMSKPKLDAVYGATANKAPVPAVTVADGGPALIANSLFHSNSGNPLEAYNTTVVNCTFALNDGHVKFLDDATTPKSKIHNSILWRNDRRSSTTDHVEAEGMKEFTHNSHTAFGSYTTDDNNHNLILADDNNNIINGTNFYDPRPDAQITDETISSHQLDAVLGEMGRRDFRVKPAARVLNRGDQKTYNTDVGTTLATDNANVTDPQYDLAHTPRWHGTGLERGAYECLVEPKRVLYVDPTRVHPDGYDGSTWEKHYGRDDLQQAIDAAAVYAAVHADDKDNTDLDANKNPKPANQAVVFIHGDESNKFAAGNLTMRDGVAVYGSLPGTTKVLEGAHYTGDFKYSNADIRRYIMTVKGERADHGSLQFLPTTIHGIRTASDIRHGLFDGFHVHTPNKDTSIGTQTGHVKIDPDTGKPLITYLEGPWTEPAVNLTSGWGAVVNCVIKECNMAPGNGGTTPAVPMVRVAYGLLYNNLIVGEPSIAGTLVELGANGYSLNNTIAGNATQQLLGGQAIKPAQNSKSSQSRVLDSTPPNATTSRVLDSTPHIHSQNDLLYNMPATGAAETVSDVNPFTPYVTDDILSFQLHEMSAAIDGGSNDAPTHLPDDLKHYVHYGDANGSDDYDLDLCGSPRLLNATVDRGCFETWRTATAAADGTLTGTTLHAHKDANTYGGQHYPHVGAVVYLMGEGGKLVCDKNNEGKSEFTATAPLRPGFVLVSGGSLYGQGATVQLDHLAIDRTVSEAGGHALVALPFAWDGGTAASPLKGSTKARSASETAISTVSYSTPSNTGFTKTATGGTDADRNTRAMAIAAAATPAYSLYDSDKRAADGYKPVASGSKLWKQTTLGRTGSGGETVAANDGFLFTPAAAGTYRFEARGGAVYEESGAAKTVTLQQHDKRTATSSSAYEFTAKENMGWNLKGLPFLVADYHGSASSSSSDDYQLSAPRIVYDMNTAYSFDTKNSWDESSTLAVGNAFFTQTAVIGSDPATATETLTFLTPVLPPSGGSASSKAMQISFGGQAIKPAQTPNASSQTRVLESTPPTDVVTFHAISAESSPVRYRFGEDGVKFWALSDSVPQIAVVADDGPLLSSLATLPAGREVPLAVRVPAAGAYTFSLGGQAIKPAQNSESSQSRVLDSTPPIILHDAETGIDTDLSLTPYTAAVTRAGYDAKRFTLRLAAPQARQGISVRGGHRRVTVTGLTPGDLVRVFTSDGILHNEATATSDKLSIAVPSGVFLVETGSETAKVVVN